MRPKRHTIHKKRPARRVPKHDKSSAREKVYIYGKHALLEALRHAPHVVRKAFLAPDMRDTELRILLTKNKIPVNELAAGRGKNLVGKDAVHQGVIAVIDPSALLVPFDDFLATLPSYIHSSGSSTGSAKTAVAVLAEMQDPHNVGAVIRSAAAFGLAGVLIPEHNQAPITGVVVKSSAGMAFRMPLISIGNVNHALQMLKEKGFWVYGLATQGKTNLGAETFDAPTVFVIGNEGAGIREKTLEACDVTLSIPMHARTESLNAAASAAIVFYEWSRKHPEALENKTGV